ncbi:hypothetical protein F66182_1241 [Fusarium sp. NRRL 66182]|nr:hypothetical protein F66182_1241 [Fusarium sp. NRRL 66182]
MPSRPRTPHDSDDDRENYRLHDIPPRQLDQLTDILWMDTGVNVVTPNRDWLMSQRAQIATLDKSNRRSTKLLDRLSARVESLSLKSADDGRPRACLCSAHHDLDAKLIRRLMLLLIAECTERVQMFRVWRQRIVFPTSVLLWLDRIDTVTGLWIGRDAFRATFGYERASPIDVKVKSKCEACIMSVIGGRPQVLSDLRASMFPRRERYCEQPRSKGPRLLRLVESWTNHFGADRRRGIVTSSTVLGEELCELVGVIKTLKRDRRYSTASGSSTRRSRAARDRRWQRYERTSCHGECPRQSISTESDQEERHGYHLQEPSHDAVQTQGGEHSWMDADEECQATIWMDCQMQDQGLTTEERWKLFEDDMHPAFGDYAQSALGASVEDRPERELKERQSVRYSAFSDFDNESAVPPPLRPQRLPPSPPVSEPGDNAVETIWEPVSVFSPPASVVGGAYPRHDTVATNMDKDADSITTTYDDNVAYLEFCNKLGIKPNLEHETHSSATPKPETHDLATRRPDTVQPAPPMPQAEAPRDTDTYSAAAASSIYSAHPGFRRSQENLPASPPIYPCQPEHASRDPADSGTSGGRRSRPVSRASSSRSSHASSRRRSSQNQGNNNLWDMLRENRALLLEDMDEE